MVLIILLAICPAGFSWVKGGVYQEVLDCIYLFGYGMAGQEKE
jgi:hypothetical protein